MADNINNQEWDVVDNNHNFCQLTNLSATLILQKGAHVMYLDNDLFKHGLYNRSIGIIIELINEDTVNAIFLAPLRIITVSIKRITKHFLLNGLLASRYQFSLQNAFALIVYKIQGLTISNNSVTIDEQMFVYGQVYVAFSRAPSWNSLNITSFDPTYIRTDPEVITEYEQLTSLYNA
ncbi:16821_t:CDS:2, partial [Dentiscutata heterogama]